MRESRIRLLTLYANYTDKFSYFDDWLDAVQQYPAFDVIALDIIPSGARRRIKIRRLRGRRRAPAPLDEWRQ